MDQDAGLHCRLAGDRIRAGLCLHGSRLLDLSSLDAGPGRQDFQAWPIGFRGPVLSGPWRQRRAKKPWASLRSCWLLADCST
jgi:hypothetical protein